MNENGVIDKSFKHEDLKNEKSLKVVYILRVSDGLQSEICGFSSKEKAEEFVKGFQPGKAQGSDIIELVLDQTKIM